MTNHMVLCTLQIINVSEYIIQYHFFKNQCCYVTYNIDFDQNWYYFYSFCFFLYCLLYYIGFRNNRCHVVYINISFFKIDVNIDKINVHSFNIDFLTNVESKKQPILKVYFLVVHGLLVNWSPNKFSMWFRLLYKGIWMHFQFSLIIYLNFGCIIRHEIYLICFWIYTTLVYMFLHFKKLQENTNQRRGKRENIKETKR